MTAMDYQPDKVVVAGGCGSFATFWIMHHLPTELATTLAIPFSKCSSRPWLAIHRLSVLVMVGASNAVNLTDGLDGLAIVPVMIATEFLL